jgi:hypothetical protein
MLSSIKGLPFIINFNKKNWKKMAKSTEWWVHAWKSLVENKSIKERRNFNHKIIYTENTFGTQNDYSFKKMNSLINNGRR